MELWSALSFRLRFFSSYFFSFTDSFFYLSTPAVFRGVTVFSARQPTKKYTTVAFRYMILRQYNRKKKNDGFLRYPMKK